MDNNFVENVIDYWHSKDNTFTNWWKKNALPVLKKKRYKKEQLKEIEEMCHEAFIQGDFFANTY